MVLTVWSLTNNTSEVVRNADSQAPSRPAESETAGAVCVTQTVTQPLVTLLHIEKSENHGFKEH